MKEKLKNNLKWNVLFIAMNYIALCLLNAQPSTYNLPIGSFIVLIAICVANTINVMHDIYYKQKGVVIYKIGIIVSIVIGCASYL